MRYIFHALYNYSIVPRDGLIALLLAWAFAVPAVAQDSYQLSAGDRIAIRVVAWDTIAVEFVEYDALNGEYVVDTSGAVMVPLLGPIQVVGKSPAELMDEMASQLQGRLGLAYLPSATISVVGYRPIYVLGDVGSPGAFTFSPGLTVLQAAALAGGVDVGQDDGPEGAAGTIRTSGTLREVGIELARQTITAARLRAEMNEEEEFVPPEGAEHPNGPGAIDAIVEHERKVFKSRREALDRAIEAIADSRLVLEAEISTLQEQQAGQSRQVELVRESVDNMEKLVERGLARSPNFTALQRQLIDLENRALDAETAVFRARQGIAELERDRIDLEANRRLSVLRELRAAESEIDRLGVRRTTTRNLLAEAEALMLSSEDTPVFGTVFRITREGPEGSEVLTATPSTRLKPSDVLEIEVVETAGE